MDINKNALKLVLFSVASIEKDQDLIDSQNERVIAARFLHNEKVKYDVTSEEYDFLEKEIWKLYRTYRTDRYIEVRGRAFSELFFERPIRDTLLTDLRKIASEEKNRIIIDSPRERSLSTRYIQRKKRLFNINSPEYEEIHNAEYEIYLNRGYLAINVRRRDPVLLGLCAFAHAYEQIQKIAQKEGMKHAIDTEDERKIAIAYFESNREAFTECGNKEYDWSLRMLSGKRPMQMSLDFLLFSRKYRCATGFDALTNSVGEHFSNINHNHIFLPIENEEYLFFERSRRECMNTSRSFNKGGDCANIVSDRISFTETEWIETVAPLKEASSPDEEREALLSILNSLAPKDQDCVVQSRTSVEIARLIFISNLLKYHDVDMYGDSTASNNKFNHYALMIYEREDRDRVWVIDTWANVILLKEEWESMRLREASD